MRLTAGTVAAGWVLAGMIRRCEATPRSDINLIAIFDDLADYSCRWEQQLCLESLALDETDHAVDLFGTDRS
ncbi:hypothetical protein [Microbacterium maritypicum]|uniref:hypothetical protein n=1 Tax=Microbacterium maritypicum TaxID=33918 RepID=UPI00296FE6D7|nr:hypothetical protein [Microbacterium liquefaciens]